MATVRVLLLSLTIFATLPVGALFGSTPDEERDKREISALYHKAEAYTRNDLQAVFAVFSPEWIGTTKEGAKLTLTQVSEATKRMWQARPGVRLSSHLLTDLTSITMSGNTAFVNVSSQSDLVSEDEGTSAHVRNLATGKDELVRTSDGWKIRRTELLTTKQEANGRPSAYAITQLQHMRSMNSQLWEFSRSNNMSNCMYSNAMQKYDYWYREQRCGN